MANEKKIITDLFELIDANYDPSKNIPPVFIGHNIAEFDLKFLFQRAVVLGVKPPKVIPFGARPWD
ncbi:3'-5' exonuclease, partial [Escherichia coli]|uniref:3'-5' exonuclease n=1 Tax=Escherichia coli TaxID=562 RepID=UPI0025461518